MMNEQEIAVVLGLVVIWGSVCVWAYKKYKQIVADGVVTIEEIIDVVEDGAQKIKEALGETDDLKGLSRMKKGALISLCKKYGLDDAGTRADLIARLKEL